MRVGILNESDYYRTVYGGWLGKNIGGTLGAPVEGTKGRLSLTFYPTLQDLPLVNDDLDLQLVWLHALEQYGPALTSRELGQEWVDHIFFPFDEYGYALTNLRRGLIPPLTGSFNNPFADCMGSPIRSEIWAMVAPGAPHIAAKYAYEDAIVDHAGGEGVFGEVFFAVVQSLIFTEKDRDVLLAAGLSFLPDSCRTARAVRDVQRWQREGKSWIEARENIIKVHGHPNFTDAPQNIAFTVLGWLYGESFEDAILKAVNCGYDTDCTAATLGAILGMILGPDGLPSKWVEPIGDRIAVSPAVNGFQAPLTLDELTKRTIRAGKQVLSYWNTNIIVHPSFSTDMPDFKPPCSDDIYKELWSRDARIDRRLLPQHSAAPLGLELLLDYGEDGPAIARGERKRLELTIVNHSAGTWEGSIRFDVPDGWQADPAQQVLLASGERKSYTFHVTADEQVQPSYELAAVISRLHDDTMWAAWTERFVLVAASEWIVHGLDGNGVKVCFSGNRLAWEKVLSESLESAETYRANTFLHNPEERTIRLAAASDGLVTVKLNGETVIDCTKPEICIPAYHRVARSQCVELTLPAGAHRLEVIAQGTGAPPQVYILPVAVQDTKQPGPHYYYTDILFYI